MTLVVHTGCLGTCPIYRIAIYDDGTVDYRGEAFVATRGRRVTHVAPAAVAELAHRFEELGFASLPDYLSPPGTDAPTITLQYALSIVQEDVGDPAVPPSLTALEQRIDNLAGVTPSPYPVARRDPLAVRDHCPIPQTLFDAGVIQQTENAGELRLVVDIGSKQGVTGEWRVQLLASETNQLLTDGAATIVSVSSRQTIVTTRATPAAKRAKRVRFIRPPLR